MQTSSLALLFTGLMCATACGTTNHDTEDSRTTHQDSSATEGAIRRNTLRRPQEALRIARMAQHNADSLGNNALFQYWQDRELDVLIRQRDTGLVRTARQLIETRQGDAAASTMEQLARWYKSMGNSLAADTLARSAMATASAPLVKARVLSTAALPAADLGRLQEALEHTVQAEALIDTSAQSGLFARILANRAYALFKSGLLDSAASVGRSALERFQALNDTLAVMQASSTLAAVATTQNDLTTAITLQNRVIQLGTELGFPSLVAANAFNKANVEKSMKHFPEALAGYEMAWRLADSCGMLDLAMIAKGARAILWNDMDTTSLLRTNSMELMRDSSLAVLSRAIADMQGLGALQWEANFTLTKAEHFNWTGRPDSAMVCYRKALALARSFGNLQMEGFALEGIGTGAYFGKDYRSAIHYWEEAQAVNERIGMPEHSALTWDRLHYAYMRRGNLPKALDALKRSKDIGFSLYSDSVTQATAAIEARFAFEKKLLTDSLRHTGEVKALGDEREIAELKSQRANTRTALIGGGAILLAIGASLAYRSDRKRRQVRYEQQATELRRQAAELANRALRAQMDPHFISNTLNAVNAGLHTNDTDAASTLLMRFAEWIRTMLETSRHDSIPLRIELEALRTYLVLEQQRTDGKFNFRIIADPALNLDRVQVPPLIVQPFLENAIEHGFGRLEQGGELTVHARLEGDQLRITVEDNGTGRKTTGTANEGRKTSLSSTITRERLQLLGERTGKPANHTITDLTQGTRVEIVLPC